VLQLRYFLGLKADVITSCCGSLFSEEAPSLSASVAASPPLPTMIVFYVSLTLAAGAGLLYRLRQRAPWLVALLSGAAFVITIAGILSFISLYVYEHPHHHCPFCILKPEYGYQGYWLYLPLFVATAAGLGVGAMQPFARIPTLERIIPAVGKATGDRGRSDVRCRRRRGFADDPQLAPDSARWLACSGNRSPC